ncbi:hypothetical protein O1611_g7425 [Lasiodiplodia mahajangana]|uniref:Uncharacterized protein n=1 Tax=Lasiodiplodia mahajangana TaxID=1108764 RepID=A0ACC2JFG6_9PEZI|nr:hypothetical protein O1611_g7425 [Lasiodiplodia mahajangana]
MIPRGPGSRIPYRRVPLINRPLDRPERPPELKNTFELTPKTCAEAKSILGKATRLPLELVDIVMDYAEYWVCQTASIDYSVTGSGHLAIHSGRDRENRFLLRTEPLGLTTWHPDDMERWQTAAPAQKLNQEYTHEELEPFSGNPPLNLLTHPVRKIVFDIVSRDQGWGGNIEDHHTYRGSWTWFDAGIDRFDKEPTPPVEATEESKSETSSGPKKGPTTSAIRPVWPFLSATSSGYDHQLQATDHKTIQHNRVAEHDWQHHHVEWSWLDDVDYESTAAQQLEANGRGCRSGDGSFVKDLKSGDMVTLWGHARFPGWVNNVQKVEIKVYWAL